MPCISLAFQIWCSYSFWEECSFYKCIFSFLFNLWIFFRLSLCSSPMLFHYIYWNQPLTANQGKNWGIYQNTFFSPLVTRSSGCCDLGLCHSLNSGEPPHFKPDRDGAGYYWRACSSWFCQQEVTAQLAKLMENKIFLEVLEWKNTGLKLVRVLKQNSTDFNNFISLLWHWHSWMVSLNKIGHVKVHD